MLPDWTPNIHPLIIHFPIVLLILYPIIEILRLRYTDSIVLGKVSMWLISIGVVSLLFSYLSGEQAIETVQLRAGAVQVATEHEFWARNTLIFYTIWSVVLWFGFWKSISIIQKASVGAVLGLIGVMFLVVTSDLGGRLVYEFGVGTKQVSKLNAQVEELQQQLNDYLNNTAPVLSENGAWSWSVTPGASEVVTESFTVLGDGFTSISENGNTEGHWVELGTESQMAGLSIPGQLSNFEGEVRLNADNFDGWIELIHNYQDEENYQFFRIHNGSVTQGSNSESKETIFQQESGINMSGWITLRVTSNNAHYYGYIDDRNITHAHGTPLPAGGTGILFKGSGSLLIQKMEFKGL